jgi:hypothetical protein
MGAVAAQGAGPLTAQGWMLALETILVVGARESSCSETRSVSGTEEVAWLRFLGRWSSCPIGAGWL